jgi:hypothetical protein
VLARNIATKGGGVMAGWIKIEKDLETDPRVLRMARSLGQRFNMYATDAELDRCNACALPTVTLVCGALARLWIFADSHARQDNTIDMSMTELNQWIGIDGFCELMPSDWLIVIDERTVELPDYQEHNGVEARKKALTQKRVAKHRTNEKRTSVTPRNASSLPDQTRPDLDQTRPDLDQTRDTEGAADSLQGKSGTQKPEIDVATQLAIDLRAMGVNITSQHPTLHQWIKEGFTPSQVIESVGIARISKPKPEAIPANYLTPILQDIKNPVKTRRSEAREHWPKVIEAVKRGAYRTDGFTLGEKIDKAVRAIGGYASLGQINVNSFPFLEKQFREAYAEQAA